MQQAGAAVEAAAAAAALGSRIAFARVLLSAFGVAFTRVQPEGPWMAGSFLGVLAGSEAWLGIWAEFLGEGCRERLGRAPSRGGGKAG